MRSLFGVFLFFSCSLTLLCGCGPRPSDPTQKDIEIITDHLRRQTDLIEKSGKILNPRTVDSCGQILYVPIEDWTSGFFPGTLWYAYALTGDEGWIPCARKYTEALDSVKCLTWHHDVGFMIGCSYLTGYRLKSNPAYIDVIVKTAESLSTRFRPGAGIIQSWNVDRGWQAERGWECPVIIDNMMNLELLFEATRFSGDSTFHKIAVSHADVTMKHHFRPDYSCYHVIDYDPLTGAVRNKHTAQGYAHESAWARGQAWALYGYVMCYRYTADRRYLDQAAHIYNFIFTHKNLPADLVPYWDFDAPGIPDEPRDVSAAAIIASALYEFEDYAPGAGYKSTADKIVESLSSESYLAGPGTNGNFILMHAVGSIPHGHEIDTPINYADYYFLEALVRRKNSDK